MINFKGQDWYDLCTINDFIRFQTLSEVAQVIGLFDHTLLVNIIMTHMSFEPTILTYGCLEVLLTILVNLKSDKVSHPKWGREFILLK